MNLLELPEDCLSQILSLTSPRDVVRSSSVSKQFLSVSTLDTVWDNFLPSDLDEIISKSSSLIPHVSKKELFMHLSDFPILLDNNTKSFALDKRSGKVCYMLGSRALSIVWGSSPQYWRWKSMPGSRFPECAVLIAVCWLELKGKIHTALLSQGTPYGVYFVFKLKVGTYTGFGGTLVRGSVSEIGEDGLPILGNQRPIKINSFYLEAPRLEVESDEEPRWVRCTSGFEESEQESQDEESEEENVHESQDEESEEENGHASQDEESEHEDEEEFQDEESEESREELLVTQEESEEEMSLGELLVTQDEEVEEELELSLEGIIPVARDDGWMEIELGRYEVGVNNDGDERVVLEMSLKEVENLYWKNGFTVHGIEIRPLS